MRSKKEERGKRYYFELRATNSNPTDGNFKCPVCKKVDTKLSFAVISALGIYSEHRVHLKCIGIVNY